MQFVRATIMLAIVSFINLFLAVTFNYLRSTLWSALRDASNTTGVYSNVNPILSNLELVFWLLFIFSGVGAIAWYILGSHSKEHEEYRE